MGMDSLILVVLMSGEIKKKKKQQQSSSFDTPRRSRDLPTILKDSSNLLVLHLIPITGFSLTQLSPLTSQERNKM